MERHLQKATFIIIVKTALLRLLVCWDIIIGLEDGSVSKARITTKNGQSSKKISENSENFK